MSSTAHHPQSRKPLVSPRLRNAIALAELPASFRATLKDDDAELGRLLRRFDESQHPSDRDALLNHLLPMVTALATFALARQPKLWEELDELISDGCALLIPVLVKLAPLPPAHARGFAAHVIRQAFWKERNRRIWGGGEQREREKLALRFRTAFIREHGQAPTTEQVSQHLASLFNNPDMPVIQRRKMVSFSSLESDSERASLIGQVPDPHREIDARAIRYALRLFKGDERKMFRMAVLDGACLREIGVAFQISKSVAYRRVNGLLWRARCDRRLASELGVMAAAAPLRDPNSNWIPPRKLPPAKLAG